MKNGISLFHDNKTLTCQRVKAVFSWEIYKLSFPKAANTAQPQVHCTDSGTKYVSVGNIAFACHRAYLQIFYILHSIMNASYMFYLHGKYTHTRCV